MQRNSKTHGPSVGSSPGKWPPTSVISSKLNAVTKKILATKVRGRDGLDAKQIQNT